MASNPQQDLYDKAISLNAYEYIDEFFTSPDSYPALRQWAMDVYELMDTGVDAQHAVAMVGSPSEPPVERRALSIPVKKLLIGVASLTCLALIACGGVWVVQHVPRVDAPQSPVVQDSDSSQWRVLADEQSQTDTLIKVVQSSPVGADSSVETILRDETGCVADNILSVSGRIARTHAHRARLFMVYAHAMNATVDAVQSQLDALRSQAGQLGHAPDSSEKTHMLDTASRWQSMRVAWSNLDAARRDVANLTVWIPVVQAAKAQADHDAALAAAQAAQLAHQQAQQRAQRQAQRTPPRSTPAPSAPPRSWYVPADKPLPDRLP